ncbi:ketopantoate reductase family protein [Thalassotalea piscium]
MNIIIVGHGAIGLLWYRHLSKQPNNNVDMVCSKNIKTPPNHFNFTDVNNVSETINLTIASADSINKAELIILCVKAFHVADAVKQLQSVINEQAIIILCHNGMGVTEQLPTQIINTHPILAMLITHGATLSSPFYVQHTGIGKADIGLLSGTLADKRCISLTSQLNNALPQVCWQPNIKQQQWEKLAINCVINPITAINNITNGDVNLEQFSQIKQQALKELVAVAKAEGIFLDSEQLLTTINQVALLTANNSSSMRCDILASRPSEIDMINGYIHQLGLKHNLTTPQNTYLWQHVKALENKKA